MASIETVWPLSRRKETLYQRQSDCNKVFSFCFKSAVKFKANIDWGYTLCHRSIFYFIQIPFLAELNSDAHAAESAEVSISVVGRLWTTRFRSFQQL